LVPAHVGVFDPRAVAPQIVVGVLAATIAFALRRVANKETTDTERRFVRWLGIGAVFSVAPGLASSPGTRPLALAYLGFAVVIAFWMVGIFRRVRRASEKSVRMRAAGVALVVLHVGIPVLYWPAFAFFSQRTLSSSARAAVDLPLSHDRPGQ